MGSPRSAPSLAMEMSEWQPARTTAAGVPASDTCRSFGESAFTIFTGTSWSVVSVPVLSKSTESILPANGTRYGSVQKMPAFMSAISAVLTAIAVCIGRERGTTDVMMITHLSSNSCVVRSPFSSPRLKTYAEATRAKHRRMNRASNVSLESSPTFCCENSIICMSSPCADEKPARRTKHRQPPSGVGGTPPLDASFAAPACATVISVVPAKSTETRSAPCTSSGWSPFSPPSASFICGTDSPVSDASFATAEPRSSTQSQGTTSFEPPSLAGAVPAAGAEGSLGGVREMRSPGRMDVVDRFSHLPVR
mmetsp:Transcript_43668/g.108688  ORF Transcript_43668/g.108688 Transcript_43668/m.108688 type:complete len:308 (-) Transcript_43668:1196-2119(-)